MIYIATLYGDTGVSAAAGGSDVVVGIGTEIERFATIRTSGAVLYPSLDTFAGLASGYQNVSGAVVAAAPTASAGASFVVGIGYFRT